MMMSSINHYKETKETNHITQEPVHMLRGYTKKGGGVWFGYLKWWQGGNSIKFIRVN